jgi:hypothetical protein
VLGIHCPGQLEAPAEPVGCGLAEWLDPLGDRIAAELGGMFCQHRTHEVGNGMLWFAQRQAYQGFARFVSSQKLGQPGER